MVGMLGRGTGRFGMLWEHFSVSASGLSLYMLLVASLVDELTHGMLPTVTVAYANGNPDYQLPRWKWKP